LNVRPGVRWRILIKRLINCGHPQILHIDIDIDIDIFINCSWVATRWQ
jgi:hypothetical protein